MQIRGAHPVRHVSVGRMGLKELLLLKQSCLNILFPINVLLTAVHHPYVTWGEGDETDNDEKVQQQLRKIKESHGTSSSDVI